MTPQQFKSMMIAYGRECVMDACKQLGVPLGTVQKLLLSPKWTKAQKEIVAEKMKGKI